MNQLEQDRIRQQVRSDYAEVSKANTNNQSCGTPSSCCSTHGEMNTIDSLRLGYSEGEVGSVPDGANMGLGCGNPGAIASIQPGETVLDLGSGGGFDCFLAAQRVLKQGRVIGVDMTPEMITKARSNADKTEFANVEFRLGEIEHLPVADKSVDVVISNCVINLSPDKQQVFKEAFRVLKNGGRLAISDVVASGPIPTELRDDSMLYSGCIAGAAQLEELHAMLRSAGFQNIEIQPKDESKEFIKDWAPGKSVEDYVLSATISAQKPLVESSCC